MRAESDGAGAGDGDGNREASLGRKGDRSAQRGLRAKRADYGTRRCLQDADIEGESHLDQWYY